MEKIRRKYGGLGKPGTGIYYDIGSGTGKPVFAAVLMHAFKRATGIEILSSLHNAALKTLEFWNENVVGGTKTEVTKAIDVPSSLVAPECAATKIEFINGDITKCVVSNAVLRGFCVGSVIHWRICASQREVCEHCRCETDISDATLLFANSTYATLFLCNLYFTDYCHERCIRLIEGCVCCCADRCFDDELMLAVVCNFCMICINIQDTSALWPAHEAMRPVHSCYYFLAAGRCC